MEHIPDEPELKDFLSAKTKRSLRERNYCVLWLANLEQIAPLPAPRDEDLPEELKLLKYFKDHVALLLNGKIPFANRFNNFQRMNPLVTDGVWAFWADPDDDDQLWDQALQTVVWEIENDVKENTLEILTGHTFDISIVVTIAAEDLSWVYQELDAHRFEYDALIIWIKKIVASVMMIEYGRRVRPKLSITTANGEQPLTERRVRDLAGNGVMQVFARIGGKPLMRKVHNLRPR